MITGSNVVSDAGTTLFVQDDLDIAAATHTTAERHIKEEKQSGIFTSPVISAVQTAQQMVNAAGDTSDPRMKALAAANVALAGKSAADAIKAGQGSTIDGKANQIPTGKTNPDGTTETRDALAATAFWT